MAILLAYDLSLPVRRWIGIEPHVWPQLEADRIVFGQLPTITLQDRLYTPGTVSWYDYVAFVIYLSHFFVTLTLLGVLWKVSYERFKHWRALVVGLATAGFLTYVLFPAVPPWLAAVQGHIEPVHRVISEMWGAVGITAAQALFETRSEFYNQEAALPSLHAAYPMLLLLFFWGWVANRWVRAGLVAYVVSMGFVLVYGGEHYVFDLVVGWVYAAGVYAAVGRWRRRRQQRAEPEPSRELDEAVT
jgi:membrane-associated phospholipid phosphatase